MTSETWNDTVRSGESDARERAEPAGRPWHRRRGIVAALLVVGYAVQVGLRLILEVGRYGPNVLADEIGYLMDARYIAGGAPASMEGSTFYRGGHALLIAPAYLISDNPEVSYDIVLGINALIAASVFPLLYCLLTSAFRIPVAVALPLSFLTTLYPPLVLNSLLAWSEVTLAALTLATAVALARLVGTASTRVVWAWGALVGVLAGFLYTTHGRTAPLVGLVVVALILIGAVRRELRWPSALGVVVALAALYAGQRFNNHLVETLWSHGGGQDVDKTLSRLSDPDAIVNAGVVGFGQFWYFAVGTFGLFVLGVIQMWQVVRRPGTGGSKTGFRAWVRARLARETGGGPVAAAVLLLGLVALFLLTGGFLYPTKRPDMLIYGRYSEILLPVFLVLGAYRLWAVLSVRRMIVEVSAAAALIVLAFLVIRGYRDGILYDPISNSYTTLSLPSLSGSVEGLHPRRAMALGLVGLAGLAVLSRRHWRFVGALGLAGAFVASSVWVRANLFEGTQNAIYGSDRGNVIDVPELIDTPQTIGYDLGYPHLEVRWAQQWNLNNVHFAMFDSTAGDEVPEVRYVISSQSWPDAERLGAEMVWKEGHGDEAVWLIPANPPAPLN